MYCLSDCTSCSGVRTQTQAWSLFQDFSFTSFFSGFRCKFSGQYVEAWLVLQGFCPAVLMQSALLVGRAGCEHCKGLGGNVWGIQVIVLSPSSV